MFVPLLCRWHTILFPYLQMTWPCHLFLPVSLTSLPGRRNTSSSQSFKNRNSGLLSQTNQWIRINLGSSEIVPRKSARNLGVPIDDQLSSISRSCRFALFKKLSSFSSKYCTLWFVVKKRMLYKTIYIVAVNTIPSALETIEFQLTVQTSCSQLSCLGSLSLLCFRQQEAPKFIADNLLSYKDKASAVVLNPGPGDLLHIQTQKTFLIEIVNQELEDTNLLWSSPLQAQLIWYLAHHMIDWNHLDRERWKTSSAVDLKDKHLAETWWRHIVKIVKKKKRYCRGVNLEKVYYVFFLQIWFELQFTQTQIYYTSEVLQQTPSSCYYTWPSPAAVAIYRASII